MLDVTGNMVDWFCFFPQNIIRLLIVGHKSVNGQFNELKLHIIQIVWIDCSANYDFLQLYWKLEKLFLYFTEAEETWKTNYK